MLDPLPSSGLWWVHVTIDGTDNFVGMRTPDPSASSNTPVFEHGTVSSAGFTIAGAIDPGSSYNKDGTITLVVANADLGNPGDGAVLDQTNAEAGPYGGTLNMPLLTNPVDNTDLPNGSYTLTTDGNCGILPGSSGPPPVPFTGIVPRYQVLLPPDDSAANGSQGEFNIGFDVKTGEILTYASSNVFRVTPGELQNPALPESCDATWEDVTPIILTTPVQFGDPILWTDPPPAARTFASNFTGGASFLFAYSDDDGANWIQASAAPPNGSADHETIGTGPYPAGSPFAAIAAASGFNNAVYYCAQGDVPASCQRSDDGGASFGPPVLIYDGVTTPCSGIHGHVKVAPDGTVWVPVRGCGSGQGYAISKDAGVTWSDLAVPGTSSGHWDPSIGIATDNTAYFCYGAADGHVHALISRDAGVNWVDDTDLGAVFGIQNGVFEEAVAGDPDRASCAFLGTTTSGNYGGLDFTGIWYPYIAPPTTVVTVG